MFSSFVGVSTGVSESTAAMVGAVAAVAGWSAVMHRGKAKRGWLTFESARFDLKKGRKSMKRFITLLNIVLVLSLFVAACGPKTPPTSTGSCKRVARLPTEPATIQPYVCSGKAPAGDTITVFVFAIEKAGKHLFV